MDKEVDPTFETNGWPNKLKCMVLWMDQIHFAPVGIGGLSTILWMDEILHHFEADVVHTLFHVSNWCEAEVCMKQGHDAFSEVLLDRRRRHKKLLEPGLPGASGVWWMPRQWFLAKHRDPTWMFNPIRIHRLDIRT